VPFQPNNVVQALEAAQMRTDLREDVERRQLGGSLALLQRQVAADLALPDDLPVDQRQLP
jgi:hypothetical protein